MKNVNLLVMFVVFICLAVCMYFFDKGDGEKQDVLLKNNLFIRGRVLNTKTSNNHEFGIILLALDSCNVEEFNRTTKTGIYPYKIKDGKAEVYTYIPDGIDTGDEVIVNSNTEVAVYYYKKSKQRFKGSIKIISNDHDVDYVKQHSVLK